MRHKTLVNILANSSSLDFLLEKNWLNLTVFDASHEIGWFLIV